MVDAIVLECLYMTFGKETILKNVNTVF